MDQDRRDPTSLVSLQERRLSQRNSAILQVEAYWEGLRGTRLVPDRAEVDPRGLTGALENAFVLERIAPGLARFRVAGMHLSDLMGLEVRGMPISAVFTPDARPELSQALEATFNEPARIRMLLQGEGGLGRPGLIGEMVLMPLRADGGEVTRALGCVVTDGAIGRQPRRLSITAVEHMTLTGYADASEPRLPAECAEPASGFRHALRSNTSREAKSPHLRLVYSAD